MTSAEEIKWLEDMSRRKPTGIDTPAPAIPGGVRCLYRPGNEPIPRTNTVPRRSSDHARDTLGQFLEANLIRPLYFNEEQQAQRVVDALDTMTLAERITIEIEMQSRNAVVHSFDYDPLR